VVHRGSRFEGVLGVLEDEEVGFVVLVEEVEVESNRHLARKNLLQVDEDKVFRLTQRGASVVSYGKTYMWVRSSG
jgi:hypothetical protein